jgi:hypothetical protein
MSFGQRDLRQPVIIPGEVGEDDRSLAADHGARDQPLAVGRDFRIGEEGQCAETFRGDPLRRGLGRGSAHRGGREQPERN